MVNKKKIKAAASLKAVGSFPALFLLFGSDNLLALLVVIRRRYFEIDQVLYFFIFFFWITAPAHVCTEKQFARNRRPRLKNFQKFFQSFLFAVLLFESVDLEHKKGDRVFFFFYCGPIKNEVPDLHQSARTHVR